MTAPQTVTFAKMTSDAIEANKRWLLAASIFAKAQPDNRDRVECLAIMQRHIAAMQETIAELEARANNEVWSHV